MFSVQLAATLEILMSAPNKNRGSNNNQLLVYVPDKNFRRYNSTWYPPPGKEKKRLRKDRCHFGRGSPCQAYVALAGHVELLRFNVSG